MRGSRGYHLKNFGLIFVLLLLTSCSGQTENSDATIHRAKLDEFEGNLLSLITQHDLVYDLKIKNHDIRAVMTTIDYYKNGQFVQQLSQLRAPLLEEEIKKDLKLVIFNQSINETQESWTSSFMAGSNNASVTIKNDISGREKRNFSSVSGGRDKATLTIDKSKVIATIAYSNKNELYIIDEIDSEEDIKEATKYEHVYIISVELKNEQ